MSYQYNSFHKELIQGRSFASKFVHLFPGNRSVPGAPYEPQPRPQTLHQFTVPERVLALERKSFISENFAKLKFPLDTLFYMEYKEVPLHSLSSLTGTLGGGLNLWTGITVLVFVEITETVMRILKGIGARYKENRNENTNPKSVSTSTENDAME